MCGYKQIEPALPVNHQSSYTPTRALSYCLTKAELPGPSMLSTPLRLRESTAAREVPHLVDSTPQLGNMQTKYLYVIAAGAIPVVDVRESQRHARLLLEPGRTFQCCVEGSRGGARLPGQSRSSWQYLWLVGLKKPTEARGNSNQVQAALKF